MFIGNSFLHSVFSFCINKGCQSRKLESLAILKWSENHAITENVETGWSAKWVLKFDIDHKLAVIITRVRFGKNLRKVAFVQGLAFLNIGVGLSAL